MQEKVDGLLAEVRQLTETCHTPGADCFVAFRDLMRRVLAITVAHSGNNVSLIHLDQRSGRADLVSGKGNAPKQPLRLRRGYLSVLMSLDTTGDEGYLRVLKSSFQYSTTREKADWVKLFKKTFRFTGGEITGEFLRSTGYLAGAHHPDCPVYERVRALGPPWAS